VVDDTQAQGVPLRRLFAEGRALPTLLLSLAFFMAFATLAVAVLWTPVLLRAQGMSAANASVAIGFHGFGALIGMAIVGRLIERFGGARVLVPALILGAIATAATGQVGGSLVAASIALALIGVFVGLGASGAIALAVLFYPGEIRSTGVGWSMGVGRLGQVIAPIAIGSLVQHDLSAAQVMFVVGLAPAIAAVAIAAMTLAHPLAAREVADAEGELVHH
jgi:MFS transporter, AAHS family, 4-hydroxybenzoate transporter